MPPIRIAIVGGNAQRGWAKDAHVAALHALPGFTIAAVSARSEEAARAAANAFGASAAYGDSLAMVRDPQVDLVAVTVKVPEHRAIVLAALAAGKHVYCEWPLGRDLAEAEEMAAAVTTGVRAVIGLQALSAPVIAQAAALIANGAIGAPRVLRVFSAAAAWGAETQSFNTYLQDRTSGATLETIGGGHTLSAVTALAGDYVEVDARCTTFLRQVPITDAGGFALRSCADHMLVLGRHASGCVSTLEVLGGPSDRPVLFEMQGETGWLRVTGTTPGMCQIAPLIIEASVPLPPLPATDSAPSGPPANLFRAYAQLGRELTGGPRTLPDFDDAVRLTRLLAAIDRASTTGVRQGL